MAVIYTHFPPCLHSSKFGGYECAKWVLVGKFRVPKWVFIYRPRSGLYRDVLGKLKIGITEINVILQCTFIQFHLEKVLIQKKEDKR